MSANPYHLGNFNFADHGQHGQQQPHFSLGNFQLPQAHNFNLPPVGFDTPAIPTVAFNAPSMLGPLALEPLVVSPPPLVFDFGGSAPNNAQASVKGGVDFGLDLSTATASHLELPAAPGLAKLGLIKSAIETGHKLQHEISNDRHAGASATEAALCAGLGVLAEAGADHVLKEAVVVATFGGLAASAELSAAGVLTGNAPLAAAGGTSAVIFSQLALPAYEGAGNVAAAFGQGTTAFCHDAFSMARQLTLKR